MRIKDFIANDRFTVIAVHMTNKELKLSTPTRSLTYTHTHTAAQQCLLVTAGEQRSNFRARVRGLLSALLFFFFFFNRSHN